MWSWSRRRRVTSLIIKIPMVPLIVQGTFGIVQLHISQFNEILHRWHIRFTNSFVVANVISTNMLQISSPLSTTYRATLQENLHKYHLIGCRVNINFKFFLKFRLVHSYSVTQRAADRNVRTKLPLLLYGPTLPYWKGRRKGQMAVSEMAHNCM